MLYFDSEASHSLGSGPGGPLQITSSLEDPVEEVDSSPTNQGIIVESIKVRRASLTNNVDKPDTDGSSPLFGTKHMMPRQGTMGKSDMTSYIGFKDA